VLFSTGQWLPDTAPSRRPAVSLQTDNWDDYHFKTLWNARLWLSSGRKVDLGGVKILKRGMQDGRTKLPPRPFESLTNDYCSLGQALSYYETLAAADEQEPGIASAYLNAMRDAATNTEIRLAFEEEPGFATSLLRESSARMALEGGQAAIAGDASPGAGDSLSITYDLPGMDDPLELSFIEADELPSRMHAVIGYNGVGKTRLLASLGMTFAVVEEARNDAPFASQYGRVSGDLPDIAFVLAISYSAFDTFALPNAPGGPRLGRGYRYCGLRTVDGSRHAADQRTLKSIDDIREDFHAARAQAVQKLREAQLEMIFRPLLLEPSFSMAGDFPELDASRSAWQDALEGFSTGHTIVLSILVQLCAYLEQRSLVLLDEPEMHLHPPLVAALLSSIQVALREFDSFAVTATHSPVVAQELPSSHVTMLRRATRLSAIEEPEIETLGENIGLLTSRIFHLDNSRSDYHDLLRSLAVDRTVDQIDAMFPRGLSAQARADVLSERAAQGRE
jgi:predicted ATPase